MSPVPTDSAAAKVRDFTTTRWSLVWSCAVHDSREAREQFAGMYWYPLYVFARRTGAPPDDAADAVQTFLSRLLESGSLAEVSQQGGRFRNFLRTGVANQLRSQHRALHSASRRPPGGFVCPDGEDPESRLALEPTDHRSPEHAFDRKCAIVLLDATAHRLQREFTASGQGELFPHLLSCLNGDPERATHVAAAAGFGLNEGTLRNKVTAFRARFRELFREQVAATLDDPTSVDDEIRELLKALAA